MDPENQSLGPCPICGGPLEARGPGWLDDAELIDCGNCGRHLFTRYAMINARSLSRDPPLQSRVAHAVWRRPKNDVIDMDQLDSMERTATLPAALERLDLLIVHLATTAPPGGSISGTPKRLKAKLGCESPEAVQWVKEQAASLGHLDQLPSGEIRLTADGWRRFAELQRTGTGSKVALMAMAYGPGPTEDLYAGGKLHQAIADTGFRLTRVDGEQADAQLIDVRMQVELRTCRFVVCDLSDNNRGAYWEAGFATGIGRPVFYLCRTEVLERTGQRDGPHFDTNHYPIIPWSKDDPGPALKRLKAMIRATLPEVATMQDKAPGE